MKKSFSKWEICLIVVSLFAADWGFSGFYPAGVSFERLFHRAKSASHPVIDALIAGTPDSNGELSLVTEPDDGTAPVLSMINGAEHSIDLVIYTLSDTAVERALAEASARGVAVRVLLNAGLGGVHAKKNSDTYNYLIANGVSAEWSPSYFALTHQKTLAVDGKQALIMTFNLDRTYYKKDKDFGIIDTDRTDVLAIEQAFADDWQGRNSAPSDGDDLIWSPGSEDELVSLIASARKSILIYNEEMDDETVEDALAAASRGGVDVEVVMTSSSQWVPAFQMLSAAGARVSTFSDKASTYIHAKMILVDGKTAFLGSENFSDASLDDNRELGILFSKPDIVASLAAAFESDRMRAAVFKASSPD